MTMAPTNHNRKRRGGRAIALLVILSALAPASRTRADLVITIVGTPGEERSRWTFSGSTDGWRVIEGADYATKWLPDHSLPSIDGLFVGPGGMPVSVGSILNWVPECNQLTIRPLAGQSGDEIGFFNRSAEGLNLNETFVGNEIPRILDRDIANFNPGTSTANGVTFNVIHCTSPNDSDGDTVPDDCDTCPGFDDYQDCNGNGLPDGCELESPFHYELVRNGFPCDSSDILVADNLNTPSSTGDVTFSITAPAPAYDDPAVTVEIYGNGALLGTLYTIPVGGGCQRNDTLTISQAAWENARQLGNGIMTIEARATGAGSCSPCGFLPFTTYELDYVADFDANDNGILDVCPNDCDPNGTDGDGDGAADDCDECPGTIAGHPAVDGHGCPLATSYADFDGDGDVDETDMSGFFACDNGPDTPVGGGCVQYDSANDNDIDLHDYLSLQDAASGADALAEVTAAGQAVPNYHAIDRGFTLTYDLANLHCQDVFGTSLANIDQDLPQADQQALIDEMTALAAATGSNTDFWIGMRWDMNELRFRWLNGDLLIQEGNSVTNWAGDGQTPTANDFSSGQTNFYALLWSVDAHKWLNVDSDGGAPDFSATGCLCDAPNLLQAGMPGGDEGGNDVLDVQITSGGSNSVTVVEGESPTITLTYEIRGTLDNTNNEGLAGFAFDLSFDGGDLTAIDTPTNGDLLNFAAPLGYNNPAGFGGTVVNGDLIQVGGGQNTINFIGMDGPTGTVITGVGHAEAILGTGTITVPQTPGTYQLSLSNLSATTINAGESGIPVWRCEPAIAGTQTALTMTVLPCSDGDNDGVCDTVDLCPGSDDSIDTDNDGVPDGCDDCEGFDDTIDADGDGVADGCDICPGFDDALDSDGDAVPDGCDVCPGFDDTVDADGDSIADGCDNCPDVANFFQEDEDNDGIGDACEGPPANDDCANATPTTGGFLRGEITLATIDGPAPCGASAGRDVWFEYINDVGVDVRVTAATCSAQNNFDSVLVIYDECGGTELACDDDSNICGNNTDSSLVEFDVPCGESRLIQLVSKSAGAGDYEVGVFVSPIGDDADGDGVGDSCDVCPGFDDYIDTDSDGMPDGCDNCPNTANASITFANSGPIAMSSTGRATPYPSDIAVSGLSGPIGNVSVMLSGVSHTFTDDIQVLLVGPGGENVLLMANAGGNFSISDVDLTFEDGAPALPNEDRLVSGTYRPTRHLSIFIESFPSPAPALPYGNSLSAFNHTDGNGVWSLYVIDDTFEDSGTIAGGWSLTIDMSQDSDGDGVGDACDNCLMTANADQLDSDIPAVSLSPVSAWRFEEGMGTSVTDQLGNWDGTVNGASWTTGVFGGGLDFDGSVSTNDHHVDFGDVSDLSGVSSFTVAMWFQRRSDRTVDANQTNHNIDNVMIAKSSGSTNDNLEIGSSEADLEIYLDTAEHDNVFTPYIVPGVVVDDQWTHLVLTYDAARADEVEVFINGVLVVAEGQWGGALDLSSGTPVTLGLARPDAGNPWGDYDGLLDEVAIFSRALTAIEVADIYISLGDGVGDACDVPCGGGRPLGDVDGDMVADLNDLPMFTAIVLDPTAATADEFCAADVTQDGNVDGLDIQDFVNVMLGM